MSDAQEYTLETIAEPATAEGWRCKKCDRFWHGNRAEHMARYCCTKQQRCQCGSPSEKHRTMCRACQLVADAERMHERVEKADKMSIEDANELDCLFCDDCWGFDGVEQLVFDVQSESMETVWPVYVWATRIIPFRLDLDWSLESACDEHHEDMADMLNGVKELQAAVDEFNQENSRNQSFEVDYSRVLVVESAEQVGFGGKEQP